MLIKYLKIILGIMIYALFICAFVWRMRTSDERMYIKTEIKRSYDLGEEKHWKRRLIKLNLSILPPLAWIYDNYYSRK